MLIIFSNFRYIYSRRPTRVLFALNRPYPAYIASHTIAGEIPPLHSNPRQSQYPIDHIHPELAPSQAEHTQNALLDETSIRGHSTKNADD